ncbi:hypothetical protein [Halovivax gelatinilyticus]|uniref:hypothetical protein n=1 Tax=Halovivax gelatinilyticus TaxID=2961597 RepID=UPI0020CA298F|nr:hypothetical protein [Halovivax gelatinilyticus]
MTAVEIQRGQIRAWVRASINAQQIMKRALTFTLTMVVAIGMLAMLGFAGGVAADSHENGNDDDGDSWFSGGDGHAHAETNINQGNAAGQIGQASAYSGGDAGVINVQKGSQTNYASATTVADGSGGDVDVDVSLDIIALLED